MSKHDDERDYDVGYGKPPTSSQFKKGKSGNPKGRPKEAKGFKASLKRELLAPIRVREGDREICISKGQAMAKRLTATALKGDSRALITLLKFDGELFGHSGSDAETDDFTRAPDPVDHEILRDYYLNSAPLVDDGTIEDWQIDDWDYQLEESDNDEA
jgi:hypothetical protein